jgi:hypothetical protein
MLLSKTGEEDAALYNRGGRCCSLKPGSKMLLSTTGEEDAALYNRGARCSHYLNLKKIITKVTNP